MIETSFNFKFNKNSFNRFIISRKMNIQKIQNSKVKIFTTLDYVPHLSKKEKLY